MADGSNNTCKGILYLTFDDGPLVGHTRVILNQLATVGARATFFLTGKNGTKETQSALLEAIAADGHHVANHGNKHDEHNKSPEFLKTNFDENKAHFADALTKIPKGQNRFDLVRMPGGPAELGTSESRRRYASSIHMAGYRHVGWSFELGTNGVKRLKLKDWEGLKGISGEMSLRQGAAEYRSIVLLHDAHWGDHGTELRSLLAFLSERFCLETFPPNPQHPRIQ